MVHPGIGPDLKGSDPPCGRQRLAQVETRAGRCTQCGSRCLSAGPGDRVSGGVLDQEPATPRSPRVVEPVGAARCEVCLAFRDEPIHQPVYGAGFFGTTVVDESLPWQADWIPPHHPFRDPPPSTAARIAGDIVAHDLDLEPIRSNSEHPGWAGDTLAEMAVDTAEHFPADSEVEISDDPPGPNARKRAATWLTSMFLFLSVATVASASTQHEIVAAEERIAAIEAERIETAVMLEEARRGFDEAQEQVALLSEQADAADRAALIGHEQARRSAAALYPEAFTAAAGLQTALNADSVQDAAVSVAYATAVAEHDEAVATTAATSLDRTRSDLVRATAGVEAQRALMRDLHVEVLELDRRLAAAQIELDEVRKATQRRLGISDDTERWRPLVAKYFPADVVDDALWVMWCESRGDPEARAFPRSSAVGLYQFIDSTWRTIAPRAGVADAVRTDPEANIAAAAWLWELSGGTRHPSGAWGPWSCRP